MILDITSFGWSGSGAYHDLLREYDDVEFPYKEDWEFDLLWAVDGIYDLEEKLCHKHCRVYDSDLAVSRFLNLIKKYCSVDFLGYNKVFDRKWLLQLSQDYIDKLVSIDIVGRSFSDLIHPNKKESLINVYNFLLRKFFGNRFACLLGGRKVVSRLMCYNPHLMRIAYEPENFLLITQEYVSDLIKKMRKDDSKLLVTDQMFPADVPQLFQKYVKEKHKMIIVRRDPRDTYLAMKKMSDFPYPIPRNAQDFIWFYKKIVADSFLPDTEDRISLKFEDVIYEYEKTKKKIESFVGLKSHVFEKKFFNPDISKNNTQLYNLYPQYKEDIAAIERALPEHLYPFEKYPFFRTSSKIF